MKIRVEHSWSNTFEKMRWYAFDGVILILSADTENDLMAKIDKLCETYKPKTEQEIEIITKEVL